MRIRLIILISIIVSLSCAEDKIAKYTMPVDSDSGSSDTSSSNNIKSFDGLQGTYNITFFGSEITKITQNNSQEIFNNYITDNCTKAYEFYRDINENDKSQCEVGQITLLYSKAVIFITNNQMRIVAKLQASSGITDTYLTYKYQHISFNPSTNFKGQGFKEYYYDEKTNTISQVYEFTESPFSIERISENTIRLDVAYINKRIALNSTNEFIVADTKNIMILEKIDNDTIELIKKNECPF